jgi:gamma-glutamyltranspeptidase/glutathione hydrolase
VSVLKLNRWKTRVAFLLLIFIAIFCGIQYQPQPPKSIFVNSAAIACAEPHAAAAGLEILERGGNAVDALVTVAFTLAVTYPRAGNIGGGGFLMYRSAEGAVEAIDFRETAPAAASYDMYWDSSGNPAPEKSLIGALAAGIPGTVRGLYLSQQKFGTLPWRDVLQPAINLARAGFPISENLSTLLKSREEKFKQFPESYRIFFPRNKLLQPGEILRQEDLARSLALIAEQGDHVFYNGEIAGKIVAAVQKHGGIFAKEDFANYRAIERTPVKISYRDFDVYSMPPPSSGGLVLHGTLNTLGRINLAETYAHNSADYIAYLSEVEKQWYAKRNVYLGDPDFVEIPLAVFTSGDSAAKVAQNVFPGRPRNPQDLPEFSRAFSTPKEKRETTHISILDASGNAVAMTYTLNGYFGSYLVAEGTGILLNNEMDDFAAKPGSPNLFGLVQGWVNVVEPGKRMLSSMTPTIVGKEGELVGILGTPGGPTIITSVLQVVLNKIDYRMTLDEAMSAGRFHHQWLPDSIYCEEGKISPETLEELEKRGFKFKQTGRLGDVQAIWKSGSGWEVCSDSRGTGFPVGY